MKKKLLPIGKQSFKGLIEDNCIYVDKTEHIYRLVTEGWYYFLSRPRRFGKSLLISTLQELFEGNADGVPTFKEMAKEYGLTDGGYSTQAAFLDYNHDGNLDLFLVRNSPKPVSSSVSPEC